MVEYWRYELTPKRRLNALAAEGPRSGALIRVNGGVADVHPWPELGDLPLDCQLARLAHGDSTPLTQASLEFASIDAAARRDGRSLFDGLTIPRSHWPGPNPPPSFEIVKLKSIDVIPDRVRLRIDFNGTLTAEEFVRIAATLPRERIDFIEDPCAYDPVVWRELRAKTGLRLALDRAPSSTQHRQECLCHTGNADENPMWHRHSCLCSVGSYDVLIVKPALEEIACSGIEVVVTSYMDHPIGQLCAAYTAATANITSTCGLITHVLFENDPFIERMRIDDTHLVPPGGTGFGFDDLLEKLPWRRL
ncbi:MAG TPA: enolase C-terminal domain-like protein [Thermoanaerobaculia bacterium]|nr:enolase C-terminal domain-like protein [Thermoanaerobaculia bacterium]